MRNFRREIQRARGGGDYMTLLAFGFAGLAVVIGAIAIFTTVLALLA